MTIIINECLHSDNTLLKLLAHYKTLNRLLKDADNNEIYLPYMDIAVKFDDQWHYFRQYGNDVPDRTKWINKLSKLPSSLRQIPNDTTIIKCDVFERELFINLDGE